MNDWLQEIWYGGRRVPYSLRLLALLYGAVVRLRIALYRNGWLASQKLPVPVIVVGNLTAGGTGKTPLTLWLARQLEARGLAPGIVLRGYGGSLAGPLLVHQSHSAEQVGDEALLLAAHGQCPVAIGADRVAAARLLVQAGVQIIVADDGLQHLRLAPTVAVAVFDGTRGVGNGRLLPAGPLREPLARLATVNLIVVNGDRPNDPALAPWMSSALRMDVRQGALKAVGSVQKSGAEVRLELLGSSTVHAVAAIGNPARFFAALRAAGLEVIEHAFPDHHAWRESELVFADSLPVLMTEKDAVKCRHLALPRHWAVPIEARISPDHARRLLETVLNG